VETLANEPMVFCHSDLYSENFLIGPNNVTVIDFSEVSIVPSSFARYVLWVRRLGEFDIRERICIPTTEGVDNTPALLAASGPMVTAPGTFSEMGRRAPGGDPDTQLRITHLVERCEGPW
jgi:Choline/ethanolamine kinase